MVLVSPDSGDLGRKWTRREYQRDGMSILKKHLNGSVMLHAIGKYDDED
jgi:hypothetical protein